MVPISSELSLRGHLAIVTGANRGIGLSTIRKLAGEGSNLIALTRKSSTTLNQELNILSQKYGIRVESQILDLNDQLSINQFIKYLIAQKIKVDILVNNAGSSDGSLIHMTGNTKLREIFESNFFGPFFLTQSVSKLMVKSGGGSIVNISSVSASRAQAGMIAYGSSKSAFSYACEVLALELADKNVRVNSIAPGLIDTDMLNAMEDKAKNNMLSRIAMGRYGLPDEVADLVLYLAGSQSSYISGSTFNIDGGFR